MTVLRFLKGKMGYCAAFALTFALSSVARADALFSFTTTTPSPSSFSVDNDSDDSKITLKNKSGTGDATGGINETILNIKALGKSENLSLSSAGFTFSLTITDTASSDSKTINFSGTINGTKLSSGSGTNMILSSLSPSSPLTFDLGGFAYTVSLLTPTPDPLSGLNSNYKSTTPITIQIDAVPIPEPASLTLWGVVGLVGAWYGRRKLQRKVAL